MFSNNPQLAKKIAIGTMTISLLGVASVAQAEDITGAGASFPAPVYAKWADTYKNETGNQVNYQSIGSSGGIKQILAKTVDFGASDAPLTQAKLDEAGLFQFPTVIGGVVLAVHLDGIKNGQLVLDGKTVADIYLGKIKKWNNPAIAKLNPGIKLPNKQIAVIRRADGSGTTFVFSSYLSKVSQAWKDKIGVGKTLQWVPGTLGGKGNEGVTAFVQKINGAIGYVEYAYAKSNNLPYARLVSPAGDVVSPSSATFSNAAKGADWAKFFGQDITASKAKNAWPITSATFILVDKKSMNAAKTKATLDFFSWAYGEKGTKEAVDLDYAALPASLVTTIKDAWKKELVNQNGQAIYK